MRSFGKENAFARDPPPDVARFSAQKAESQTAYIARYGSNEFFPRITVKGRLTNAHTITFLDESPRF